MEDKIVVAQGPAAPAEAAGIIGGLVSAWDAVKNLWRKTPDKAKELAGTDAESGEAGISKKYDESMIPRAQQELDALSTLSVYGWSREKIIATAKEMEAYGFGEPGTIYGYLAKAGQLGFTGLVENADDILSLAKYMLIKMNGDVEGALGVLKTAAGYAAQMPEVNLIRMATDWLFGGKDPAPTIAILSLKSLEHLGEPGGGKSDFNYGEVMTFFQMLQTPLTSQFQEQLHAHMIMRWKRRVQQQVMQLEFFTKMLGPALAAADRQTAFILQEYQRKGYLNNPILKKALLVAMYAYTASVIWNTMTGATGVGKSVLPTGKRASSSDENERLAFNEEITRFAATTTPGTPVPPVAPGIPTPGIPGVTGPTTPITTGNAFGGAGTDYQGFENIIQGINTLNSISETDKAKMLQYSADIPKLAVQLSSYMSSVSSQLDTLSQQIAPEQVDTGEKMSFDLKDARTGLITPEDTVASANDILMMCDYAKQTYDQIFSMATAIMNMSSTAGTSPEDRITLNGVNSQIGAYLASFKKNDMEITKMEAFGNFALAYAPIQREISILQIRLARIHKMISTWNETTSPLGDIMKASVYPYVKQEIDIYNQMIALNQQGITRINQIQSQIRGQKTLSFILEQFKKKVAVIINNLQMKIYQLVFELVGQDVGKNSVPGMSVSSPLSSTGSSKDNIFRYAEEEKEPSKIFVDDEEEKEPNEIFADDEEEKEPNGLFKDADKELQDYWNKLLPVNRNQGYGDILEHPQKNRHLKINYKPKKFRRMKNV